MLLTILGLIYRVINWAIYLYMLLVAAYALLSWFPGAADSKLGRVITRLVSPYLNIFERFIPPVFGLDLSPIIGFGVLSILNEGFTWLYYQLVPLLIK